MIFMSTTSSVSFRVDKNVKQKADSLFAELGLNMTTAFNIFLRQALRERRLPFDVAIKEPNAVTIAAMLEAEQLAKDPNVKRYHSAKELFEDLDNEEI